MTSLQAVMTASLGPWREAAAAIDDVVRLAALGHDALEASARGHAGSCAGGRMMIERLTVTSARALLACLPVRSECAAPLLDAAEDVPLIAGWDTARPRPVAKIYINLSDHAEPVRRRVAAKLGIDAAPHVIGRNIAAGSAAAVETKIYRQLRQLPADAPAPLLRWSADIPLAGVVESLDATADGGLRRRALFVAPRETAQLRSHLQRLPGWDSAAFDAAIPYTWQQIRSVGFAADASSWVVYVKPAGQAPPLWSLEPAVCVRCADGEVGVFIAPRDRSARSYGQTTHHALSYRIRAGHVAPADVAAVMAWAIATVGATEELPTAAAWARAAQHLPERFDVVAT